MNRRQQVERAIGLYTRAITLIDPIRLRAWSDLGLTLPTLKVAFLLRAEPGVPSGVIATRLTVTPSTITGLVDRLVHQGLARREEDSRDRRLVRNYLTEEGMRTVNNLERLAQELLASVFEEMEDADLETLVLGLSALMDAADRRAARAPVPV